MPDFAFILAGFAVGLIVGLTGVGGGSLMTPILMAGLGHASLGSVDWPLLAQLLMGSLPGIWLGSRLVSRTPGRLIRSILSVLLARAGAKLVLV